MAWRNPVRVVGTSVESWLSCVFFSYSSHWIVVHWKIFSTLWFALVSQLRGLNMGHVTCNMGLKTCISVCVLGRLVCFSYFLAHSVSLYKNHFFFLLRMNSVYLCWWVTADVQLSDHLHRWVRRQEATLIWAAGSGKKKKNQHPFGCHGELDPIMQQAAENGFGERQIFRRLGRKSRLPCQLIWEVSALPLFNQTHWLRAHSCERQQVLQKEIRIHRFV